MRIHRFARATSLSLLIAQVVSCAAHPTAAPPAKDATVASAGSSAKLATSSAQPTSEPLPVDATDDPIWGSPNAPVTIVEFSDLQCPFCSRVHPTVKQLETKYGPDRLRIVFKHEPLSFHVNAMPAAKVADAVFHQGGSKAFYDFLDLAFSLQNDLSAEALRTWSQRVGLDPALVAQRAELPATADKIQRDIALAAKVGANGTPAFRINGAGLSGAQPLESFTALIDAELAAAADLRSKGTPPSQVYALRVAANYAAPAPTAERDDADEEDLTIYKVPIKGAPASGPADALVTIVEFFDYQCPYCRRVEATMTELKKLYPKDVRVVLRQNPLPFHAHALPAANFALEARAEKGDAGFFAANEKLFERGLEDDDLLKLGKELKLDDKRVRAAIANKTVNPQIEADQDLAVELNASGTPHFFINGQRMSGAQPLSNFVSVVDAQLKVANALVAAGTPRANVYEEIMKRGKEAEPPEQKPMPTITAENPTRGPVTAPVVIHEFSDFQCPYCARVEPTLLELEKAFPNKLRFVWHDYPLPFHDHARPAALSAREVRAEKGDAAFWKLHDALFRDQKNDDAFSSASFDKYAAELQVDPSRVALAQTDGRFDATLARDKALADAAGINGTPAFVINGYYISGAQPLSAFKRAVRRALADLTKPKLAVPSAKP